MKLGKYLIRPSALALMILVLVSGTTIGALRIGTDDADTLIGTNRGDQLNGKGGNDTLRGLAGNDTYAFGEGWGIDTVEERARHKVTVRKRGRRTTKRIPGGFDTLSFATITSRPVEIRLNPDWVPRAAAFNSVRDSAGNQVDLGTSPFEGAVGSSAAGFEIIEGGAGRHVLDTGGGTRNALYDHGGWNGANGYPALPPSNDVFRVDSQPEGVDDVNDWGGEADVLDLRPHKLSRVVFDAVDADADPLTRETLQIVTSPTSAVYVISHFGPYVLNVDSGRRGKIETLIFADATVTDTAGIGSLAAANEDGDGRRLARLRLAAPGLAAEARRHRAELLPYLEPEAPSAQERNGG